ncbi:hypothetical protein V5E97_34805 [Singulisphaera sp. Ch08]|uniref:Transporter n=1 Tax=Singulisphaera sp. Ch08 TaxID=3120278 RepID=A0AAU7CEB6_9BACT
MAGSQALRLRGAVFAAALAFFFLTFADLARAQYPTPPSAMSAGRFADLAETGAPPVALPNPTTVPQPSYYPGVAPAASRVEMGLFDTITESIFGKPDPNTWRPLPLSTLFSEGWNEAWVPSPNGSGGAPRQGWINAADGNLYRLSFFTFAQGFNRGSKGDGYLGAYTIFAPLSRRLDLIINVPFVLRNNAVTGLPVISPNRPGAATPQSHTGFGDLSFTPRVLLHETKDFSLTGELAILTPTGTQPLAGKTTVLTPSVGFWNNFAGGWVLRGGLGLAVPMDGSGDNLISQLAIGHTLTEHDVPFFGDFTYYLSVVANTPLADGDRTSVTLTPGMRTHVGNDWYFLAGLPTPVTHDRVADLGMIFWFMKAW